MPKPIPILILVEEIAAGSWLRKLHEGPGIIDVSLPFNLVGWIGGAHGRLRRKQKLEEPLHRHPPYAASVPKAAAGPIVMLLLEGPKHITEISAAIGGKITRAYSAMTNLRKDGLTESGDGQGMHQLTAKARAKLGGAAPAALSPPQKIKRGPAGRAAPGSGPIILRAVLGAGPVHPSELRKQLADKGMSTKSISGVLDRGKKQWSHQAKRFAALYELTAKGLKIELGAQANG